VPADIAGHGRQRKGSAKLGHKHLARAYPDGSYIDVLGPPQICISAHFRARVPTVSKMPPEGIITIAK